MPAKRTPKPATKPAKARKAKTVRADSAKLSALDAAAQVLAASTEPLNCKQLIEAMAAQGLWRSPGGKTPQATLHSAIAREIATKGTAARFIKTGRGHFASRANA